MLSALISLRAAALVVLHIAHSSRSENKQWLSAAFLQGEVCLLTLRRQALCPREEESQRRGPGSGQVLRLGTSPEKEKKNSYFGEEHVLCCLDEGILSFVNVWGLGRCLFFLCVQYCLVNVGREKNGLSMSVRLRGFFASSVTICRV